MTRSHRGRKGDGWPKRPLMPALLPARPDVIPQAAVLPDVCPQVARCGHVVCSIVWYCMENG